MSYHRALALQEQAKIPPEFQSPVPGVSLYDLHRKTRTVVDDNSTTTIQVRSLNVEITCPICLGILHQTQTVMECLHRFCAGCISKCLRTGKKECPACRVKCTSTRNLRRDPNFDGIISSIYPNLEDYEAKEESMIDKITQGIMSQGAKSLADSVASGLERQALAKKKRKKGEEDEVIPTKKRENRKPQKPEAPVQRKEEKKKTKAFRTVNDDEINCVLLLHPNETRLTQMQNRYLRTSKQLKMKHLCKFLALKFPEVNKDPVNFRVYLSPKSTPLGDDVTLGVIERDLWSKPEDMTLYYRLEA